MDDSWVWKDGELSSYSVNSAYAFLRGELEGGNNSMYVKFWKSKALSSAHITALRVLENRCVVDLPMRFSGMCKKFSNI